ncbi:MAG TPA: FHA domain-containing protein [Thermoanaerobaculia bacterium]|nr:FHA domain-containing protein [Thermoanaerobaculia bacterium]
MQVVLQGSLRHFTAAELLRFLCSRGRSGTLDLETTGLRTRVFFENDRIVWAEGTKEGEPAEAVLETLQWTSGSFTLLDSVAVPENVTRVSLELSALLEEAKRRADTAAMYADATTFRVVDDPALQQQVSLTADEFKVLFRIGPGKTFRELVAELGAPPKELGDRLRHLASVGLLAVATAPAESSADRKPEPGGDKTMVPKKKTTVSRKRSIVGSLTPDSAPDNVYPLLESEYTIGRSSSHSISIPDGSVSSNHARILRTDKGFVLEDLQSRNGTFVNGEKLTEPRLLVDGDLIRVGKIIMTFNVAREEKAGETTQPEVRL